MSIKKEALLPYMEGLFESACVKLFERMDQEIVRVSTPGEKAACLSSRIYSMSDQLSVSLLLVMPVRIIEVTLPAVKDPPEDRESLKKDWVLELSNQMLGRFKNKLLSHDCVLKMGLPALCDESGLEASSACTGVFRSMYFEVRQEVIECHLCFIMKDQALTLSDHEDEDEDWFSESELEHL